MTEYLCCGVLRSVRTTNIYSMATKGSLHTCINKCECMLWRYLYFVPEGLLIKAKDFERFDSSKLKVT